MSKRFGRQQRRKLRSFAKSNLGLMNANYKLIREKLSLFDKNAELQEEIKDLRLRLKTPHHINVEVGRCVQHQDTWCANEITETTVHLKPLRMIFEDAFEFGYERSKRMFRDSVEQLCDSTVAELKDEAWKGFRRLTDGCRRRNGG